jgi:hypothetical protein
MRMPIVKPWAHIRAWTTFCEVDWCLERAKLGEGGGKAPRRITVPITHDDSTSDGHAGSPAAQYDLVLMAGNPS